MLQKLQTFLSLTVASTIVAATELTIKWNGIEDVDEISSAGQTIPLIIAFGLLVRVIYVARYVGDKNPGQYDFYTRDGNTGGTRVRESPGRLPPRAGRRWPQNPGRLPPRFFDQDLSRNRI